MFIFIGCVDWGSRLSPDLLYITSFIVGAVCAARLSGVLQTKDREVLLLVLYTELETLTPDPTCDTAKCLSRRSAANRTTAFPAFIAGLLLPQQSSV